MDTLDAGIFWKTRGLVRGRSSSRTWRSVCATTKECGARGAWQGLHDPAGHGLSMGDTRIGDHFQAGYNSVVRALVKIGDYCTLMKPVDY